MSLLAEIEQLWEVLYVILRGSALLVLNPTGAIDHHFAEHLLDFIKSCVCHVEDRVRSATLSLIRTLAKRLRLL